MERFGGVSAALLQSDYLEICLTEKKGVRNNREAFTVACLTCHRNQYYRLIQSHGR
jgi:hypothetical protein